MTDVGSLARAVEGAAPGTKVLVVVEGEGSRHRRTALDLINGAGVDRWGGWALVAVQPTVSSPDDLPLAGEVIDQLAATGRCPAVVLVGIDVSEAALGALEQQAVDQGLTVTVAR